MYSVVTGTQVSLEFLQITISHSELRGDVSDWIKRVLSFKDLLWNLSRKKVSEMCYTKQYKHVKLRKDKLVWAVSILTAERLDHALQFAYVTLSRIIVRELSIFLSFYMYFH